MDSSGAPEEGASAVEFALVSSLLFLLVFAIIQFGILFAQELAVSNGASQGARAAAVGRTCEAISIEVYNGAQTIGLPVGGVEVGDPGALDAADALVDVQVELVDADGDATSRCEGAVDSSACVGAELGDQVLVTATANGRLIIPFTVSDESVTIDGTGMHRCEYTE